MIDHVTGEVGKPAGSGFKVKRRKLDALGEDVGVKTRT